MAGSNSDAALAIPVLLTRYADAFDAGDFAAAAKLFDGGCVVVDGKEIAGAERIAAMWNAFVRLYPDGTPRTRHLVTNLAITTNENGTAAECRSQWTVLQQPPGEPLRLVGSGRYHDDFVFEAGAWRFSRRRYAGVDFWGDAASHLKQPVNEREPHHGTV
jgi:3-phenylpropionate/cinnamic acid dioxygenase small subunit